MRVYSSWMMQREPERFVPMFFKIARQRGARVCREFAGRVPLLRRIARPRVGPTTGAAGQADETPVIPADLLAYFAKHNGPGRALRARHNGHAPRVLHYIGGLVPGGAERQLCNFVGGAVRRGWDMRVLISNPMTGDYTHYAHLLHRVNVFPDSAGAHFNPKFLEAVRPLRQRLELLTHLPAFFLPWTIEIFGELLADPPDLFHAWLDHTNVWGGIAALLADVPVIILSTRNVNPDNFPYMARPEFRPWYQLLAASPRVHFINNSTSGARDYAAWLGLPEDRFHVVRNGIDFSSVARPAEAEISQLRASVGLPAGASVVVGVFRLSAEKRPLLFAEVVARAMAERPNLHALIVGVGPLESDLHAAIGRTGFGERFHLLGRRHDVATIISAADLLLLTSLHEGTPNVVLEAQWLGRPVVATTAGGTTDAVSHGETGLLVDVEDVDGLAAAVASLLDDAASRQRFGSAGPRFIETHFGLDRMVDETLQVYEHALSTPS